ARRGRLRAKPGAIGLFADADVQAEHSRAMKVRRAVKIAIVLGHDGGKGESALRLEVAIGVVDEECVAPGDLRAAACVRGLDEIDTGKRDGDVSGARGFVHRPRLLVMRVLTTGSGFRPPPRRRPGR